jgi:RNA polymerase sigma factor (sigma-70 family)
MKNQTASFEQDRQLLSKCISGDRNASEILVRRFSDLIYKSVQCTLLTKHVSFSSEDLEDFHNTVFLQLFEQRCKKLRQYEGKNGCSLASWIRLVAVRIVLNHLRKRGMDAMLWQKKRVALEDIAELRGEEMEPGSSMAAAEQERLVRDGIQSLPPRDRLFMKLHFDEGLPVEEVAAAMQITVQNAYTVKHRAIQRLKSYVTSATK